MKRAIRLAAVALFGAAAAATAPTASAVEFSLLGPTIVTVRPGELFTVDIALDNVLEESVAGITGQLTGLYGAGAIVMSGRASIQHFVQFCSSSYCLGGVDWSTAPFWNPNDLSQSSSYSPGDDRVRIANALGLGPTTADGSLDPGVDRTFEGLGARDVTLDLIAQNVGVHILTIGGTFSDGMRALPIVNNATLTLRVIPEPGTALLLGLGLLGLAGVGRR